MQLDRIASPTTTPLFETINVSKAYGAYMALSNISFGVSDGEFVSIVGPNGAGKTTVLRSSRTGSATTTPGRWTLANVSTRSGPGDSAWAGSRTTTSGRPAASGRSNWRVSACHAHSNW